MSRTDWYDDWLKFTPMGRVGEPREVANAVVFLASDASSFFTGSNLVVAANILAGEALSRLLLGSGRASTMRNKVEELLALSGTSSYFHIHTFLRHIICGSSLLSSLAFGRLKWGLMIDLQ